EEVRHPFYTDSSVSCGADSESNRCPVFEFKGFAQVYSGVSPKGAVLFTSVVSFIPAGVFEPFKGSFEIWSLDGPLPPFGSVDVKTYSFVRPNEREQLGVVDTVNPRVCQNEAGLS